jgi:Ca2+-transporting ATPase
VTLAHKGWAPEPGPIVAEKPFSSERKRMGVLVRDGAGYRLHVKGAPEVILGLSDAILTETGPTALTGDRRREVEAAYEAMASGGQRVIALAARAAGEDDLAEDGLTFLGLVGLIDPPRPEVAAAIRGAREAGVRVIMITGDGALTARAVAREIGLGDIKPIEGPEIERLSDEALGERLRGEVLFARTRPEHKLRIVEALRARGEIVAMTGDGVNDAPALKRADIGVAMGIRGTDVSKGAADLVLLDDNFATIVGAIAEGRRQFDNVRKFVHYLLASNAGEVVAILANLVLGGPLVFLATQILWMNLITDSVTAVALGLEKAEDDQMRQPPRRRDEPILGPRGAVAIALFGLYTGTASLWIFYTLLPQGTDLARTAAFTGMVVFEKVSVFAFRSLRRPVWSVGWLSNPVLLAALTISLGLQTAAVYAPPLQALLRTAPLTAEHWGLIASLALPLLIVPEAVKTVWLWRERRPERR